MESEKKRKEKNKMKIARYGWQSLIAICNLNILKLNALAFDLLHNCNRSSVHMPRYQYVNTETRLEDCTIGSFWFSVYLIRFGVYVNRVVASLLTKFFP